MTTHTTRELFAKHGATVEWKPNKAVVRIGRDSHKIVCSPAAFRWLKALLEHTDWTDPGIEAELAEAHHRRLRAIRRRDNSGPPREYEYECGDDTPVAYLFPFVGEAPPLSEFSQCEQPLRGEPPFAQPEYDD